jgi:bacteriocin biosynthesis cyclodehydratase domain-containing protein
MIHRPAFGSLYQVHVVRGEGVLLLSDRGDQVLCGTLYEHLAPWLTGEYSSDELVARLASEHEPAEVYYALLKLEDRGCLGEAGAGAPEAMARAGYPIGDAPSRARAPKLAVSRCPVGRLPPGEWVTALERAGLVVREPGDITVALADDYLRPELEDLNRRALEAGRPWLLIKAHGPVAWIGPLFVPGQTCCWKCLEHRLRRNSPVRSHWWTLGGGSADGHPPTTTLPPPFPAASSAPVARILARVADGSWGRLAGAVLTCEAGDTGVRRHLVARRPQCVACGNPSLYTRQVSRPLRMEPSPKKFTTDGGHRSVHPRETVRSLAHLISPVTGVVHDVRALTAGGAGPLLAYVADYAGAADWSSLKALQHSLRTRSGGKGRSSVQARASALGEAIERYCGTWQGDEPRVTRSFAQLGDRAIHPNSCMQFSEAQYRAREDWNRRHSTQHQVPERFDPTAPTDWTPVWSLTERCHKYLPTMYLYYGCPRDSAPAFCWADSNGCAAGTTRAEAIVQGFLELVERDCVALWWYNRVRRPALDPSSLQSSFCRTLRAYYRSLAREFWVLDITSDLGIPCFVAVSRQLPPLSEKIVFGFGAHFDARIAVMRALTELNQVLAVVLTVESERRRFASEQEAWLAKTTITTHPYLCPSRSEATRLGDFPRIVHRDLRDDVRWCQRMVEQRGMELLVLDQTRPDINAAVVRVIVPGLRHFRARFAPGRLYDVPAALGWLPKPLSEEELNTGPVFV